MQRTSYAPSSAIIPPPVANRGGLAHQNYMQRQEMVQRQELTLSTAISPFGCCNFFDQCNDELLSLYFRGTLGLLDWMGFNPTPDCYRSIEFINFVRPAFAEGSPTAGYISNPCADPNGIEFGACKLTVEDFGLYGRSGPSRNIHKPLKYCKTYPRYFLDGSMVGTEFEWDAIFTMDAMLDDVRRHLITGNSATPGQFDGLERWVRTGYDCESLNSMVFNWNGNPMTGGAGITFNGAAVGAGFHFVDVLRDANARINQRISWSPLLRGEQKVIGNKILVMPTQWVQCFLDQFTCWFFCSGSQYEETVINTLEGRDFRNGLNGGLFGDGVVSLDGEIIPILAYDWELIKSPSLADIYLLTGAVGNVRLWEGEHLDANASLANFFGDAPQTLAGGYFTSDGGRVLGKRDTDNLCWTLKEWMALRLFNKAPWANARFQNVQCQRSIGPLSPDPLSSSFYVDSDLSVSTC